MLDADTQLQSTVTRLLAERERRARGASLMQSAEAAQAALLALASRMHAAERRLTGTIERAHETLAEADERSASGRSKPVATLIEYAERVSYSNAAPCGEVAFAGAERNMFYQVRPPRTGARRS